MAQSGTTVTSSSPTPPTNFGFAGGTPPSIVPNYTKTTYADTKNWGATNPITSPPPFADDGTAGVLQTFATNTSALASGSADTAGGTGNPTGSTAGTPGTYPGGTLAISGDPPWRGTVPASTSLAHEGSGTEVTVTAPGNISYSYPGSVTLDMGRSASCGPTLTPGTMPIPNALHASTLSPATNPALASISPTTATSGASGTDTVTFTGTNFTKQSVAWVLHGNVTTPVQLTTTFVSATSLTAPVPKRTAAGASTVYVITGGAVVTTTKTITYT